MKKAGRRQSGGHWRALFYYVVLSATLAPLPRPQAVHTLLSLRDNPRVTVLRPQLNVMT